MEAKIYQFPTPAQARRKARLRGIIVALTLQEVSAIDLVKSGYERQLELREKYYRNPNLTYKKDE